MSSLLPIDLFGVIKQLEDLDEAIDNEVNLLIIGSVALMLRGLNERKVTTDIDSFIYYPLDGTFSPIDETIKATGIDFTYFNSHAYESLQDILYSLSSNHFEMFELDIDFDDIKIYLPSIEMMVVFKLVAYSTNGINNTRDKDWVDLGNEKLMSIVDLNEVYDLIMMLSNKTIRLHKLQTRVLNYFLEYKSKVNDFRRSIDE